MKLLSVLFVLLTSTIRLASQQYSCPTGQADMMKYFAMSSDRRADHFLKGEPNSILTKVFPDTDFAPTGYWF